MKLLLEYGAEVLYMLQNTISDYACMHSGSVNDAFVLKLLLNEIES